MSLVIAKTDRRPPAAAPSARRAGRLTVANLGLIYRTAAGPLEALRDVSMAVEEGEFVSVLGPSGCGKTSLLKIILGLERATSGRIAIDDHDIDSVKLDIGAVFQSPVLLPWRTIGENVLLPLDVMKLDRSAAKPRIRALLQMVGLGDFADRYPYELSGGMQQRAAIVRALVHDPRILIMDEPFAALDAMNRELMALELQRIWMESGKSIVFITHSIQEAVILSDRIVVMSARPARITATFRNPAPRPRAFADLGSPELIKLSDDLRRSLDSAVAH